MNFLKSIFKLILVIDGYSISYEIALMWMLLDLIDYANIGSSNGLVPNGTDYEPIMTHFYVPIWYH